MLTSVNLTLQYAIRVWHHEGGALAGTGEAGRGNETNERRNTLFREGADDTYLRFRKIGGKEFAL